MKYCIIMCYCRYKSDIIKNDLIFSSAVMIVVEDDEDPTQILSLIKDFIKDYTLSVTICTNARSLENEKFVLDLFFLGVNNFCVSFFDYTNDSEKMNNDQTKNYYKALKGLKNLNRLKKCNDLMFYIDYTINVNNYLGLNKFIRFASDFINCDCLILSQSETNNGYLNMKNSETLKYSVMKPYLIEALEILSSRVNSLKIYIPDIPPCIYTGYECNYLFEGGKSDIVVFKVTKTEDETAGVMLENVTTTSKDKFVHVDNCNSCVYEKKCKGILNTYISQFGDEDIIPVDYFTAINSIEKNSFQTKICLPQKIKHN